MHRTLRLAFSLTILAALALSTVASTVAGGPKVLDARMTGIPTGGLVLDGVTGGGLPWRLDDGRAKLFADGRLEVEVEGLVLVRDGTNPVTTGHAIVACGGAAGRDDGQCADVAGRRRDRDRPGVPALPVPRSGGLLHDGHGSLARRHRLLTADRRRPSEETAVGGPPAPSLRPEPALDAGPGGSLSGVPGLARSGRFCDHRGTVIAHRRAAPACPEETPWTASNPTSGSPARPPCRRPSARPARAR